MRRRTSEDTGGVPSHLATFNPADWPVDEPTPVGEGVFAAWRHWAAAREAWSEMHGWPGTYLERVEAQIEALRAIPDPPFDPSTV